MEIVIKQIRELQQKEMDMENREQLVDRTHIYFDVIDGEKMYVDNENIGYFPLMVEGKGYTQEALVEICHKWITDNNVLSVYTPKTKEEYLIQTEIRELAIERLKKKGIKLSTEPQ